MERRIRRGVGLAAGTHKAPFAVVLPLISLAVWSVLIGLPTAVTYSRIRRMAPGSGAAVIQTGSFTTVVPESRFLSFAFERAAFERQAPVVIVYAPAKFIELIVSLAAARAGNWHPDGLLLWVWRAITYPLFALPAWVVVGRTVDDLVWGGRMNRGTARASIALAVVSAALSAGLRFGLTAEERLADHQVGWWVSGFALWAALFSMPVIVWLRRRRECSVESG